jgi:hypothetical protein
MRCARHYRRARPQAGTQAGIGGCCAARLALPRTSRPLFPPDAALLPHLCTRHGAGGWGPVGGDRGFRGQGWDRCCVSTSISKLRHESLPAGVNGGRRPARALINLQVLVTCAPARPQKSGQSHSGQGAPQGASGPRAAACDTPQALAGTHGRPGGGACGVVQAPPGASVSPRLLGGVLAGGARPAHRPLQHPHRWLAPTRPQPGRSPGTTPLLPRWRCCRAGSPASQGPRIPAATPAQNRAPRNNPLSHALQPLKPPARGTRTPSPLTDHLTPCPCPCASP